MNVLNKINWKAFEKAGQNFKENKPFPHVVIDDFFERDWAMELESAFPDFGSDDWHCYNNAIEVKKTTNNWNKFKPSVYTTLMALNSDLFLEKVQNFLGLETLYSDPGLNGGGLHIHGPGGKLNTHMDYSLHPKTGLERKLNLIIYLNSEWRSEWGGQLGLWSGTKSGPEKLVAQVEPKFNRAALFDTTMNSWHGLPAPLQCPQGQYRKSLATYYMRVPQPEVDPRGKALFAPTEEQKYDLKILELIRKRAEVDSAESVYSSE